MWRIINVCDRIAISVLVVLILQTGKETCEAETMEVGGKTYLITEHKEKHPVARMTPADEIRGYVIFIRDDPTGIYPASYPAEGEITQSFSIFAAPGEYEPVSFAIYPLHDLKKVKVDVTDLVNEKGGILAKDCVDTRMITCWIQRIGKEYRVVPELLEKIVPLDIKEKSSQQYWLTFRIPRDAVPGQYKGRINVIPEDGRSYGIHLDLQVLPFTLAEGLPYRFGCWAGISGMDSRRSPLTRYTWEEVELRLRDMKEHGMNCMVYDYPESTFDYTTMGVRGSGKLQMDFTTDNKVVELYKQAGLKGPVIVELSKFSVNLGHFLGLEFPDSYYRDGNRGSHLQPPVEKTPGEYIEAFKEGIRQIYRNAMENNWPHVYLHINDEPLHQGMEVVRTAAAQYRWAKEAVPEAKTFCTLYSSDSQGESESIFKLFSPYLDLRVTWPGPLSWQDKELNERMIKEKVYRECWTVSIELDKPEIAAYARARLKSGFKFRKDGVTGSLYWHYGHTGQQDGKGGYLGMSNGDWDLSIEIPDRNSVLSYRSPKDLSVVPTLAWEGIREGIDDVKYILLLENLIEKGKKSREKNVREEACSAEKMLNRILDSVPWQKVDRKETVPVSNPQMNKYRWQVCQRIMKLTEALGESNTR